MHFFGRFYQASTLATLPFIAILNTKKSAMKLNLYSFLAQIPRKWTRLSHCIKCKYTCQNNVRKASSINWLTREILNSDFCFWLWTNFQVFSCCFIHIWEVKKCTYGERIFAKWKIMSFVIQSWRIKQDESLGVDNIIGWRYKIWRSKRIGKKAWQFFGETIFITFSGV